MGYVRTYKIVNEEGMWKFTGEKERATLQFSANGNGFTENWEIFTEEENWQPLCKLQAKRIN